MTTHRLKHFLLLTAAVAVTAGCGSARSVQPSDSLPPDTAAAQSTTSTTTTAPFNKYYVQLPTPTDWLPKNVSMPTQVRQGTPFTITGECPGLAGDFAGAIPYLTPHANPDETVSFAPTFAAQMTMEPIAADGTFSFTFNTTDAPLGRYYFQVDCVVDAWISDSWTPDGSGNGGYKEYFNFPADLLRTLDVVDGQAPISTTTAPGIPPTQ